MRNHNNNNNNNNFPDPIKTAQSITDKLNEIYTQIWNSCVCKSEKHHHHMHEEIFDYKKEKHIYTHGGLFSTYDDVDTKGHHHMKHTLDELPVLMV